MEGRKHKPMIPIACRYVPYDRYFITHGDPVWKVKHLKQRILARALSLPIDTRRLDPDYVYVPPSTSVNRRKTGKAVDKKGSKEVFSASGDDGDEPWNARNEVGEGKHSSRRAPSPITFAGAEMDRDSDQELGSDYFSAASLTSDGAGEHDRVVSSTGSSSASDEEASRGEESHKDESDGSQRRKKPTTRRRGGSVSPIEFANPIVLRRKKSASMGAFLYEKGVEAGLVLPLPKSEKAKGKQKAKDTEGEGDGVVDEEGGDREESEREGEGDTEEEVEAGYHVDDDDSEDWSDDYDDEDLHSYLKVSKEAKELPPERPETPPPGGRILPGGDGTAVPSAGEGGKVGSGGAGVHFAAPATPRSAGKKKKRRKGASIVGPLSKIAKTVTGTSSHQHSQSISSSQSQPQRHSSQSQMVVYGPPPDPSEQILTLPFALMRFSTGQLLEDDLPISWYDLRPYELLEVHFVQQPRRFEVSVRLGAILTRTVRGAPFALGGGYMDAEDYKRRKHIKGLGSDPLGQLALALENERERDRLESESGGASTLDVPPRPDMFFHTETRELVSLPRENIDAYVKPYWEGWARALRSMTPAREFHQYPQGPGPGYVQPGQGRDGQGKYGYTPHGAGNNAKYAAAEHPGAAGLGGGGGAGMAVWDPAMNTYGEEKEREAEVDVDALRGHGRPGSPRVVRQPPHHNQQQSGHRYASGHGHNTNRPGKGKTKLEWRERWVVVRDDYIYLFKDRNDPSPTHQLALSTLIDLRDAEHLAHNQYSKERRSRTSHTPVPPPRNTFSPERAQTSHGDERRKRHRRSTSTPRPSTSSVSAGTRDLRLGPTIPGSSEVPPLPHGRVLSPEEMERKRKLDRDLEALSRWDDFGASFNFGKKETGKGREKERAKGSEKEGEQQKQGESVSIGAVGEMDRGTGGRRQRSVDAPRERTKQTQDDREWLAQEREREEAAKDPRTYIPASRDDAEAAGMKIICAKFRYRGSRAPSKPSKSNHWYTSTGPSLAGEFMPDPELAEKEQVSGPYPRQAPTYPTQTATALQPPTVPGRQMGITSTVSSGPSLLSNAVRSENTAAGPVSITGGSKFGLAGLFSKDKESDDPLVRREKEERKREEKERKAREKEQKQLEKDRKKEDRRRKDEDEFRGISSLSSSNAWSSYPSTLQYAPSNNLSAISTTSAVRPLEGQSTTDMSLMTFQSDDTPTTPKADQSRPQLKISPISTQQNVWDEDRDGSDSDVSFSSPVFAHSTASSDDDDFALARDRRGYRYGGYHAPATRKRSVPTVTSSDLNVQEDSVGARADSGKAKSKEEGGITERSTQDNHIRPPVRPTGDNERGEWLVLDLGSDSAFTSLLRILHRQKPSIPSSFLPHSITDSLTSHPDNNERVSSQHESLPSSPITSQESGKDGAQDNQSGRDDDDDSKLTHPEDLSSFMPNVSTRKVVSAPALPYPEWRTELVKYARFAGMREMERPLHLVYTAWGRDKKAKTSASTYSQRNKKSDSIWARRTRSSFVRTVKRKQTAGQAEEIFSPTSDATTSLAPQHHNISEDDQQRQKRISLVSHVSTIKASKSSASRTETMQDSSVPPLTDNDIDRSTPTLDETLYRSETSGGETDGEVILEVVSDEGFAYGRQDEEVAVAEALGWPSDDTDEEESEFEWAAWVTDLPRQHAISKQTESQRQRKMVPPTEQSRDEDSAPLSPMMFANPFVPDLVEPVMVYDAPRNIDPRSQTPPPNDPEEERTRYIRKKRRGEPHATSVSEPFVHSHPNVSTTTLHHSSASSSTLIPIRTPSRTSSSTLLSTQRSVNSLQPLSSPSSTESLANGQRLLSARFQGRTSSLNVSARQGTRLRLQSNPTSPLDGTFSPSSTSMHEHETSSQTFPRQRPQRQHSRSVSGSDSIFEGGAAVQDQDIHGHGPQSMSASRPSGLHHSASMPSTRIASTSSSVSRTPQTVTFSSSYDSFRSDAFSIEQSMEHMPDDGHSVGRQQTLLLSSSPTSSYALSQSPRHHSGHSPSSIRIAPTKSSNSVLKQRRSDLERVIDQETDVEAPLSPALTDGDSTFSSMPGNYPTARGPAPGAFSSVGYPLGSGSYTPLDKAKALVRRVRSGSSLGGHEIQTVVEEHPQWENENSDQQRDVQHGIPSGSSMIHQPKKKKSAIDRLVRGFESSLDFMEGR